LIPIPDLLPVTLSEAKGLASPVTLSAAKGLALPVTLSAAKGLALSRLSF